jgi:hypothetical protein
MLRRKKLLILIPALLLIPILLGMIPLKMAHKLAQGVPFAQSSQGCSCSNCPAHSLTSHNHFDAVTAGSISPNQGLPYSQETLYAAPEFFHSDIHFRSIPLRC